jgi:hypothetical protein
MDTFTIKAEDVNVEELMKEIHRRVLEKKQAGVYTDTEIKRITDLKNDLSPKKNERYSEMSLHLRKLHSFWDVAASGGVITSHRKILGPVLVFVKRVGFTAIRFFGSAFFTRQTEYNAANVRFNTVVLEELVRLSEENRELRQRQEELLRQLESAQYAAKLEV